MMQICSVKKKKWIELFLYLCLILCSDSGELRLTHIKDKENSRVTANLTPLSLAYDITPPDLVSAVVTERAILPCTSVPVILRIKPSESVM